MKIIKHGFVTPKEEYPRAYNGWPTVISLSDGTLLAAWSGNRLKHICPFGEVKAARSTDGGYTWGEPYVVMKTPLDNRDGGLCEITPGKILLTSFASGPAQHARFLNHWLHGVHTAKEREMLEKGYAKVTDADKARYLGPTLAVSSDNGYTFSEPKHIPLTSPHGPMITKDGNILHIGSLGSSEVGEPGIYVERLDGECNVIGEKVPVMLEASAGENMHVCEPYAAQMPNGDILAAIRVQNKYKNLYTTYLCRSTDGGKTFSTPEPTGWNGLPAHIFVTSKDEVVLAYGRRDFPMGIRVRVSRDNGYTWGEEIVLRNDGLDWDLGYPTTTENERGELVTVYYMKDKLGAFENRVQYTVWTLD